MNALVLIMAMTLGQQQWGSRLSYPGGSCDPTMPSRGRFISDGIVRSGRGDTVIRARPSQAEKHAPPVKAHESMRKTIVRLCVNGEYYGSGTILSHDNGTALVATAGHMFRDPDSLIAYQVNSLKVYRIPAEEYDGTFISMDPQLDIALLSFPLPDDPDEDQTGVKFSPHGITRETPKGCIVGFGTTGKLHEHKGSYKNTFPDGDVMIHAGIDQGDSGGGAFDGKGDFAGVAVASVQRKAMPDEPAVIVPAYQVKRLIETTPACFRFLKKLFGRKKQQPQPAQPVVQDNNQNVVVQEPPTANPGPTNPVTPPAQPPAQPPVQTVDLSGIERRLDGIEQKLKQLDLPITFETPNPDGTTSKLEAHLGEKVRFKIPSH